MNCKSTCLMDHARTQEFFQKIDINRATHKTSVLCSVEDHLYDLQ